MASNQENDDLENWNPMADDYNDPKFNSYQRGPARNMPKASINNQKRVFTVYMTGVPRDLNEDGLRNLLRKAGKVGKVTIPPPRDDKDDKIAFVIFVTQKDMEEAIRQFDGYQINKYKLRLSVALTKEEKAQRQANHAALIAGDVEVDQDDGRGSSKENQAPLAENQRSRRESRPHEENRNPSSQQNQNFRHHKGTGRGDAALGKFLNNRPSAPRGGHPNDMQIMRPSGIGRGSPAGAMQHPGYMDYPGGMNPMMPAFSYGHSGGMPFQAGRGMASPYMNGGFPGGQFSGFGMGGGDFSQVGIGAAYNGMPGLDASFGPGGFGDAPERFQSTFLDRAINAASATPMSTGGRVEEKKITTSQDKGKCIVCGKLTGSKCPKCKTRYCSPKCQKGDWDEHRKMCSKLAENNRFEEQFNVEVGDDFMEKIHRKLEMTDVSSTSDVGEHLRRKKRVYLKDFPSQELGNEARGEYVPVEVVHFVQPRELYVQYKTSNVWQAFKKNTAMMETVYAKSKPSGYVPEDDEIVVVEEEKEWKRGAIHQIYNDKTSKTSKYVVHLIDEGRRIEVQLDRLRRVNDEFTKYPCQAVSCCLSDIKPNDSINFGSKACSYVEEWCAQNTTRLECCVVGRFKNKKLIILKAGDEMLNQIIIDKKLVTMRDQAGRGPMAQYGLQPGPGRNKNDRRPDQRSDSTPKRPGAQGGNGPVPSPRKTEQPPRQSSAQNSTTPPKQQPSGQNNRAPPTPSARERNLSRESPPAASGRVFVPSIVTTYRVGSQMQGALIYCESPTNFWIQMCCEGEKIGEYKKMFSELISCSGKNNVSYRPAKGDFVVAQYEGVACRACVIAVRESTSKCKVRFIDYGNVCILNFPEVHPLDPEFASLESVGVNCALAGVEDVRTEPWSKFAQEVFMEYWKRTGVDNWDLKVVKIANMLEVEVRFRNKSINEEFVKRCQAGPTASPNALSTPKKSPIKKGNSPLKKASPEKMPQPTPAVAPVQPRPAPKLSQCSAEQRRPMIPQRQLEVGVKFEAVPAVVVSAEEFYIQPLAAAFESNELTMTINEFYQKQTTPSSPRVGDLVAAQFMGEFSRGLVKNVNANDIDVFFLDFGNTDPVAKDVVFELQQEFLECPQIAIRCRLANSPKGWSTSADAIAKFKDVVKEQVRVNVVIVEYQGDVALLDVDTDSTTASAVMRNAGFALEAKASVAVAQVPAAVPEVPAATKPAFPPKASVAVTQVPAAVPEVPAATKPASPPKAATVNDKVLAQRRLKSVLDHLEVGAECRAVVTHLVSPVDMFIQAVIPEVVTAFYEMLEALAEKYSAAGNNTSFKPTVGDFVATAFEGDWCRGQVCAVSGSVCTVYFIDYGNEASVPVETVHNIDEAFLAFTVPGVKAAMAGVTGAVNGSWSVDAIAAFSQMVPLNTQCLIKVVEISGGVVKIEMFDLEKTRNFIAEFIAGGHAITASYVPPAPAPAPAPSAAESPVVKQPTPVTSAPAVAKVSPQNKEEEVPAIRTLPTLMTQVKVGKNYGLAPLNLDSVDPFYAVFLEIVDGKAATEMRQEYNEVYNKRQLKPNFRPKVGDIVAAKWDYNQEWQRSRILSVDEKYRTYKMFHVDLGHTSEVTYEDIRPMDKKYCSLPELILPCKLVNLAPADAERAIKHISHCTNEDGLLQGRATAIENGVVVMDVPAINVRMGMNETTGSFTLKAMPCVSDTWFISHEETIAIHYTITPSKFFAQPFSLMTKYDNLGTEMTEAYQTMPVNTDFKPEIGDVVAAPFQADKKYYRSVVLGKDGETVFVRYIDWGNDQMVDLQRVYRLKDSFMKDPYGAMECSLHGVEPVGEEWSQDARDYFASMASKLNLVVVEKDDTMKVNLLVDDGLSVGEMMVQHGFAVALQPTGIKAEGDPSSATIIKKNQIRGYKVMAGLAAKCHVVLVGDPDRFYIHIMSDLYQGMVDDIGQKINVYACNEPNVYLPKCQEMVIAKWQGEWFRAAVLNVQDPQEIKVHFIDYGNDDVVTVQDVRKFIPEFATPALGIECSLANIKPSAGHVSAQQVKLYNSLVQSGKAYWMKVISVVEKSASIELYEDNECINHDLARLQTQESTPPRQHSEARNLAKASLHPNTATGVVIAVFNAVDLYLNLASDADRESFIKFSRALHEYCQTQAAVEYQPIIKEVIAAMFEGVWYRAEVTTVNPDGQIGVFFLDFGNSEMVSLSTTRIIPDEMMSHPVQGIACKLADIEPIGDMWAADALRASNELLQSGSQVATSLRNVDSVHHIKLEVDTRDGKIIDLGQMLVKCGYATSTVQPPARAAPGSIPGVMTVPAAQEDRSELQRLLQEKDELIRRLEAKIQSS